MSRRALAASTLAAILLVQSGAPAGDDWQDERLFDPLRGSLPRDEPQPIYNLDPLHPWNRVFHLLFTRTLQARVIAADTVPAVIAGDHRLALSGRSVTRIESGDRAIEPLYPSWIWMGSTAFDMSPNGMWRILREPQYSRLVSALRELPSAATAQSPLARALMQADLWATYDLLYASLPNSPPASLDTAERRQRTDRLMPLLAEAIRALALTRSEIAALTDTYAAARRAHDLPGLFDSQSGWMEIRWFPDRMHEHAVDNRRAARVFLKPVQSPADEGAFLTRFRDAPGRQLSALEAVALVIQNLLIASDGSVVPSPITSEVQIRRFDVAGMSGRSDVFQYELSRQHLLEAPHTGGLRALDADSPVYLPIAGNDLSFATPPAMEAEPLVVPLRQRCSACHGPTLEHLSTFSMIGGRDVPPVVRLNASEHAHPRDVAARKMTLESWRSLQRYWSASR